MAERQKPPGIKDVAKYADVSISTVSNVLNGTKTVSAPLQERVQRAVEDLHYEVNRVARGLKSGRTDTVAVVVPSVTSVFFPPLLKNIQTAASENGYVIDVFGTNGEIEEEKKYIQILKSQQVDGILLSSCIDTEDESLKEYMDSLSDLEINERHIPLICLEAPIGTRLDGVVMNDEQALYQAVEHLISIGRRKIAYIAAPFSFTVGKMRRKGVIRALEEHGIPANGKLIVQGDYSPISGYHCMQAILQSQEKVDAVAAGNDQMAIGAMRAILDAGLRIPEDIAVTGYDDNFPATLVSPSLTTIHTPREEMGQTAFDLFLRRMENPDASRMLVTLDGELVVRNSTDPTVRTKWNLENW